MAEKSDNRVLVAALGAAGFLLQRRGGPATPATRKPHHLEARRHQTEPQPSNQPSPEKPSGLWTILKRVFHQISDNQLMTQAAAITFYALLSLFPALAALVSIYGLIADPATIVHQVDSLSSVLPGGGQELLSTELKSLASSGSSGLGIGLVVGIATSLWTSNQAMKAIFNALNAVHDVPEKRGFFKLTAMTLACTVGAVLFVVVAVASIVIVPAVLGFIGLGSIVAQLVNWLRWPLVLIAITLLLAVLYRYGPSREKVSWRWVTWGSGFAAIFWIVVSVLFSWYVANFGSYNKTYGSLGAVVGFMTWIWISSLVVLIGAQLDAELEKATIGRQHPRATSNQPVHQT